MRNFRISKSGTGLFRRPGSAGGMKRAGFCVAFTALVVMAFGASAASAAEPWWHLNTVSAPASHPGDEGRLVVEATDLGDTYVNGSTSPVTVVDTLPAGVVPLRVFGEGGGAAGKGQDAAAFTHCAIAGQVVTCTYDGKLLSYERLMVAISVEVAPGAGTGVSEVSVSGGGALPVASRRALALSENVPAYGAESYELTPEEEGGAPDTQAGSHPFQLTTTFTFNTKAAIVEYASKDTADPSLREIGPEVQPVALTKDLRFDLPPGLVGNPNPLPKCSTLDFTRSANVLCPNDTVVGVATPIVTNSDGTVRVPLAETVPLYILEPAYGEPARFGFTTPAGPVVLDTSVRTGGGYGVVVTVPDITDAVGFIGSQVTFWGVPADPRHDTSRGKCLDQSGELVKGEGFQEELSCPVNEKPQPFLIMPTSCTGALQTSVEGDSWAQAGQFTAPKDYTFQNNAGQPVAQDGCNRLNFEPSISVAPDGQQASTPTGLTVGVHVGQEASLNPTGLAESSVKDTTVALPEGVGLNPAGADGLSACGLLTGTEAGKEEREERGEEAGIDLETPQQANCPESSKVGTVTIKTPLLPNLLEGAAYLATQDANPFGSLVALYIVAYDPVSGVRVKLAGEVQPNPLTGQLTSTFKETPQLPFEALELHFFGGSRAPLGTPALCGGYTTTASIAPWSGNAPAQASSEFQITSGPNGTPCPNPPGDRSLSTLPFGPSLTTGSLNLQAGAFTPFTMTMSREDGNQNLQAIQLKMPPGLSGLLTGVKLCGAAEADAGTCGPESLIGETTVSVGLGANPYTVTGGKVYITGPTPVEGPNPSLAPFGLSIVNPAKAGPFNLGQVIVRAAIEVDPHTADLTITSEDTGPYKIPQFIDGIPLQIKHVNVTINGVGGNDKFTFNPTNCGKLAITGALSSAEGATRTLSEPFQVTNCATLKFAPKFTVSTAAKTSKARGASLSVKLAYPNAPFGSEANLTRVKVDLPKQLPSRLTTLQKACTAAQFHANPAGCPAASIIGHAKAITPLIPVPLEGPAYFVSNGGEAFPNLIVVLQGYGVRIDLVGDTFISKAGITSSTFKTVPDAPVGSFELNLPESKYSALAANGNLCALTRTATVKKKVKVRIKGHAKTVTRNVKTTKPTSLTMPTEFAAQNGAVIHQSTKIAVTGCPKKKSIKHKKHKKKHHKTKKGHKASATGAHGRGAPANRS